MVVNHFIKRKFAFYTTVGLVFYTFEKKQKLWRRKQYVLILTAY